MRTHVAVRRPLDADPWPVVERFLRSPELWLPLPARPVDEPDTHVAHARLGPLLHCIRITVGEAWTMTDTVTRQVAWTPCNDDGNPVHTSALPSFAGRLTLRHDPGAITLALEGTYEPPGGALGGALDRALLHRSGDATARGLIEDVIVRLQAHVNEETPR